MAIAAWMLSLRAAQLSPNTLATRKDHLQRAARALGGDPWSTPAEQLLGWVAAQDWKRETRRSVYASLRSFWRWGVRAGLCEVSPAEALPKVKAAVATPRPTPEAIYSAAWKAGDERDRLILDLAAQLGMRRNEIALVHERDISPALIGSTLVAHGKGGKDRDLPLLEPLLGRVEAACRAGGGWAFPGDKDGHLSAQRVGNLASRLMPAGWTLHTLRHRAGTVAYAGGAGLLDVMEMLGHVSVATTQRYVKPPADGVRRAVEVTSGLRRVDPRAEVLNVTGESLVHAADVGAQLTKLVALAALVGENGLQSQLLPVLGVLERAAAVGGGQGLSGPPGLLAGPQSGHCGDDARDAGKARSDVKDDAA